MKIVDSIARFDDAADRLELHLFPFKLTDADLEEAASDSELLITFGRESPDPATWSDWVPHAEVDITFAGTLNNASKDDISFINFVVFQLNEKNYSANFNRDREVARESLQKFEVTRSGDDYMLHVMSRGTEDLSGVDYTWDINVTTRIIVLRSDTPAPDEAR